MSEFPMHDDRLLDEIIDLLPPCTIPVAVRPVDVSWGTSVDLTRPGLEVDFVHPNEGEYFIVIHALADFDYDGQKAFFQIAKRGVDAAHPRAFGEYRYCFAYRGGTDGVSWDDWHVDLNFGTERPTHTQFGSYCDDRRCGQR